MLPRSQRLHRSKEIQCAMRKGKRVPIKAGVFFFLPSQSQSRGCVITPKKIGNSVVRHRTARRVREALRNFFARHPVALDVVVLAHSKDLSVSEWEEALRKASL